MLLQDLQDLLDEEEKQKENYKMERPHKEIKANEVRKRALETLTPEKGAKAGSSVVIYYCIVTVKGCNQSQLNHLYKYRFQTKISLDKNLKLGQNQAKPSNVNEYRSR